MSYRFRLLSCAIALCLASPAALSANGMAHGEPSLSPKATPLSWRGAAYRNLRSSEVRYDAIPAERLLQLQQRNIANGMKAPQIGIGRRAGIESRQARLPRLQWMGDSRGNAVARLRIASPDAMGLRVGLDVSRLPDGVELRFAGSARPDEIVAMVRAADAKRLPGPDGLYWTPNTDGEAQIIEIFRPAGVKAASVALEAPMLSHLVADTRSSFKLIEKIGESGSCNVDVICRVNELGPAFASVKNAVAHMRYVRTGGGTYICTGTLLNDTVPGTQVPYFHTANHCFTDNGSVAPVASQMQSVANTLITIWNYETTGCGNLTQTQTTQLPPGATYLYSSHVTDGMLLRLNNAAPAGAFFAGWNAKPLNANDAITGIHHPAGDSKMVSTGQTRSISSSVTRVAGSAAPPRAAAAAQAFSASARTATCCAAGCGAAMPPAATPVRSRIRPTGTNTRASTSTSPASRAGWNPSPKPPTVRARCCVRARRTRPPRRHRSCSRCARHQAAATHSAAERRPPGRRLRAPAALPRQVRTPAAGACAALPTTTARSR